MEGLRMYFSDMTIFTFQVTAALMMGWDYLMPAKWRDKMNIKLRCRFVSFQGDIDRKIMTFIRDLISSYRIILASIFALALGLVIIDNLNLLTKIRYPSIAFIISSIGAIALASGGLLFVNLISKIITHFFAGGIIPRILLTFLIMTEKGPFAGMGFIILLISFFMRYQNIIHQPLK